VRKIAVIWIESLLTVKPVLFRNGDILKGCHRLARWSLTLAAKTSSPLLFFFHSPRTAIPLAAEGSERDGGARQVECAACPS